MEKVNLFYTNKEENNTSGITDEEIWAYIARKNIYGIEQAPCFKSKTVKQLENATLKEQIEYVKKRFRDYD